jgi:FkbM family methyltransferase
MNESLHEEAVRLAYKLLLGREVESDRALQAHLALGTVAALRRAIMSSPEFQAKVLGTPPRARSKWVATEVLDRFTMWVNLGDRYVSAGCLNNSWEPSESQYLISRLRAGDVMLDIGANVGWFSLLAISHIGRTGLVHAFEPRPEIAAMLRRTIADNSLREQVSVWEFALSDCGGEVTLQWERDTDNPGHTFLASAATACREELDSTRANAVVLDELLPDLAPDLIKIDVEGAEPKALAGATNAIRRRRPAILSELYPEQLQSVCGVTSSEYIRQLESLGYACYLLENGRPTRRLRDFPADASRELVSVVFEYAGSGG